VRWGAKRDKRYRIGWLGPHALDLTGKIDHAVATAPARSDESKFLEGLRIDQVHKERVLPRIARLTVRADLPLGGVVVAEVCAFQPGARMRYSTGLPPCHFT